MRDNIEVLSEMLARARKDMHEAAGYVNKEWHVALCEQELALMEALRVLREAGKPTINTDLSGGALRHQASCPWPQDYGVPYEHSEPAKRYASAMIDRFIETGDRTQRGPGGLKAPPPPQLTPHEKEAWDLYCSKGSFGFWHELSMKNKASLLTQALVRRQYRRLYHGGSRRRRG